MIAPLIAFGPAVGGAVVLELLSNLSLVDGQARKTRLEVVFDVASDQNLADRSLVGRVLVVARLERSRHHRFGLHHLVEQRLSLLHGRVVNPAVC